MDIEIDRRLRDADVSRRSVLGAGSLVALSGLADRAGAQPPPGASPPATIINSELKQVGPNSFAFLLREAPGQSNISVANFGIVIGPTSLLAIDAGGGPQHARNFIAAAKRFGKPFDRIVISHSHPDHIVGLTQFAPGIEIVAQEDTRADMIRMGEARTPPYWKSNPAWARPDDVNRIILPTVTFNDRMTFYYGDAKVDVAFPGRAHTAGDALIKVPGDKVIFMGDIAFFQVTPLNGSGFVADWIKVCDTVLADPGVETIVPGHGPVGTKADLIEMRDYLALLLREGRKGFAAGKTAGRTAADIDLGKYANWTDPDRLPVNMARLFRELNGTISPAPDQAGSQAAVLEYNRIKRSTPL